jgi:hypothetical protein
MKLDANATALCDDLNVLISLEYQSSATSSIQTLTTFDMAEEYLKGRNFITSIKYKAIVKDLGLYCNNWQDELLSLLSETTNRKYPMLASSVLQIFLRLGS